MFHFFHFTHYVPVLPCANQLTGSYMMAALALNGLR